MPRGAPVSPKTNMKKSTSSTPNRAKSARLALGAIRGRTIAAPTPAPKFAKFNASKFEHSIIRGIAARAVKLARENGIPYDQQSAEMDITACHCNGCPLELDRLRDADAATFGHDVLGIRRHINRTTGELGGMFLPRTALPQ
jgi:hypothetical protein